MDDSCVMPSGKSFLLREIIKRAPEGKTFVTASTGIAAVNIGGTTVHAFAGGWELLRPQRYGLRCSCTRFSLVRCGDGGGLARDPRQPGG
jgi:hypothetical protein